MVSGIKILVASYSEEASRINLQRVYHKLMMKAPMLGAGLG